MRVRREAFVDELGDPLGQVGQALVDVGDGLVDPLLGRGHHGVDDDLHVDAVGLGDLGDGLTVAEGIAQVVLVDADGLRRGLQPDARAEAPERATVAPAVARRSLRPGRVERLIDGVGLLLGDRAVGDEAVEGFADPVVVVAPGPRRAAGRPAGSRRRAPPRRPPRVGSCGSSSCPFVGDGTIVTSRCKRRASVGCDGDRSCASMGAMPSQMDDLEAFALGLPGAFADMPWEGDVVAKVGKKIFVFFGSGEQPAISVKLPESADHALATPARCRPRTASAATAG